jgi:hypothetical protein
MPKINKNKKVVKKPKAKTTLVKAQPRTKAVKNPLEYYECMKACCLKKQKISQTAHECRTNALVINKQMSLSLKEKPCKKFALVIAKWELV